MKNCVIITLVLEFQSTVVECDVQYFYETDEFTDEFLSVVSIVEGHDTLFPEPKNCDTESWLKSGVTMIQFKLYEVRCRYKHRDGYYSYKQNTQARILYEANITSVTIHKNCFLH